MTSIGLEEPSHRSVMMGHSNYSMAGLDPAIQGSGLRNGLSPLSARLEFRMPITLRHADVARRE
jgi:hypothetical protein